MGSRLSKPFFQAAVEHLRAAVRRLLPSASPSTAELREALAAQRRLAAELEGLRASKALAVEASEASRSAMLRALELLKAGKKKQELAQAEEELREQEEVLAELRKGLAEARDIEDFDVFVRGCVEAPRRSSLPPRGESSQGGEVPHVLTVIELTRLVATGGECSSSGSICSSLAR